MTHVEQLKNKQEKGCAASVIKAWPGPAREIITISSKLQYAGRDKWEIS